jgi:hypothetical protein
MTRYVALAFWWQTVSTYIEKVMWSGLDSIVSEFCHHTSDNFCNVPVQYWPPWYASVRLECYVTIVINADSEGTDKTWNSVPSVCTLCISFFFLFSVIIITIFFFHFDIFFFFFAFFFIAPPSSSWLNFSVFWDKAPCNRYVNRRFGGTYDLPSHLLHYLVLADNRHWRWRWYVPSKWLFSYRLQRRCNPVSGNILNYCCENLKLS